MSLSELERSQSEYKKKQLISRAEYLSNFEDWKRVNAEMNILMEDWKKAGFAGKEIDDTLWKRFSDARQTYFDRQHRKSSVAKEQIIKEANWARNATDLFEKREAATKLAQLRERWKTLGSAGKADEKLWEEFNRVQNLFYKNRELEFSRNEYEKSQLASEAHTIAFISPTTKENADKMKSLQAKWKSIGSAGKAKEDSIWQIFRDAQNRFWDKRKRENEQKNRDWEAKHAEWESKQQAWRTKTHEAIQRRHSQISNLESQISNLQSKIPGMKNQEYINNMYGWIAEKEQAIRQCQREIDDMQSRL